MSEKKNSKSSGSENEYDSSKKMADKSEHKFTLGEFDDDKRRLLKVVGGKR